MPGARVSLRLAGRADAGASLEKIVAWYFEDRDAHGDLIVHDAKRPRRARGGAI
jgi:hypothetical protein